MMILIIISDVSHINMKYNLLFYFSRIFVKRNWISILSHCFISILQIISTVCNLSMSAVSGAIPCPCGFYQQLWSTRGAAVGSFKAFSTWREDNEQKR